MKPAPLIAAAFGLMAFPANAAPIDFSSDIEGHVGYALDPRLQTDRNASAGFGRIRIAPLLTQATSLSQTTLSADYQREQYTNSYGDTQSISAVLAHTQALTEHLHTTVSASYFNSDNVLLGNTVDPALLDGLSDSNKAWNAQANGSLTWQLSRRDSITAGGIYAHGESRSSILDRSYDEYGGNFTYLRALNARTSIGIRMNATRYNTTTVDTTSLSPALVLQQALSPIWKLNADVGVIIQRNGAPFDKTSTGLGFHGSLCGTYPRTTVCVTVARDNSASAFSGARRQLSASATYTRKLTELSTLSLDATFLRDDASVVSFVRNSKILRADADYNRRLSERLSAGLQARGGYRSSDFSSARSLAGSVYVRWKIG